MVDRDFELPIHGHGAANSDGEGASCGPTVYVSNEEASILAAMRGVKAEADAVRMQRSETSSEEERADIDLQLAELRSRWSGLADQREAAFRRKMIMLGHLPPDDEVELF